MQYIKGFGLQGNSVRALSGAVGLVLGLGYQASLGVPTDFAGWFAAVIFGLGLGLGMGLGMGMGKKTGREKSRPSL